MKEILSNINKAFESRIRLGIMSVLMVNDQADFRSLRDTLEVTDGNLASHLRALEDAGYIVSEKRFLNKKPNTTYRITAEGTGSFRNHINALEELLKRT
jgi:DNA-binding MarR family transcriptional regulator